MNAPKECDPAATAAPKDTGAAPDAAAGVVEWVAFCAGETRLIDYQAAPSKGVTPGVAQAVVHVCRRFHPEAQPRLLTRPAYLLWRIAHEETWAEWAMTRIVPVPVPETERRDFDYMTLLLTGEQMTQLEDPFVLVQSDGHGAAMQTFRGQKGDREPLLFSELLPRSDEDSPPVLPNDAEEDAVRFMGSGRTGAMPWSEEAEAILRADCKARTAAGKAPPTFATWWLDKQNDPLSLFEIVLTQTDAAPVEETEAVARTDSAARAVFLAGELLPLVDEQAAAGKEAIRLSQQIAQWVHEAQWTQAQSRDDTEWAARMAQAANDALTLAGLLSREAGGAKLAAGYFSLAGTLRGQRHPRTGRSVTTTLTPPPAATAPLPTGSRKQKTLTIAVAMAALLATAALSSAVTAYVITHAEQEKKQASATAAIPLAKKKPNERNNTKSH